MEDCPARDEPTIDSEGICPGGAPPISPSRPISVMSIDSHSCGVALASDMTTPQF